MIVFFFFQAEDGIRDLTVTGVQTCALPISWSARGRRYETSHVERNLCGKLPIRVGKGATGEPELHFTNNGPKGTEERMYRMRQNVVRRVREGDEMPKAPRGTSPAR